MVEIRIREAIEQDVRYLAELVSEFRNEHSRMIGGQGNVFVRDGLKEVERYRRREDTGYFVAVDARSRIVGFRRWEQRDGFHFTRELYVTPAMRRKGVAKELIRHFEQWVLEKGQQIACISCTPHNAAMIALARSEGYTTLNTIELRKNLDGSTERPRGETHALGLVWELL